MTMKILWCYTPYAELDNKMGVDGIEKLPYAKRVWANWGSPTTRGAPLDTYEKYTRFRKNRKKAVESGEIEMRREKAKKKWAKVDRRNPGIHKDFKAMHGIG